MARTHLLEGACPACDRRVPRTVHCVGGMQRDVYHCSQHGRLEYGPADVPLAALGAASTARPTYAPSAQPAGITMLDWVH